MRETQRPLHQDGVFLIYSRTSQPEKERSESNTVGGVGSGLGRQKLEPTTSATDSEFDLFSTMIDNQHVQILAMETRHEKTVTGTEVSFFFFF